MNWMPIDDAPAPGVKPTIGARWREPVACRTPIEYRDPMPCLDADMARLQEALIAHTNGAVRMLSGLTVVASALLAVALMLVGARA